MLTIERAGLQTLIVDRGRPGYAHLGVPRSGALDPASLANANVSAGNPPDAAGLECVLRGPKVLAPGRRIVATAPGAYLAETGELDLRRMPTLRMWVAVSGGIVTPAVLGSRSADLLGGVGPAPLSDGDELPLGASWRRDVVVDSRAGEVDLSAPFEVVSGPDPLVLEPGAWTVQPHSDRTALRLDGPARPHGLQGVTRGLVPGAIQVPPDGRPVIFLAGHPATGGYPIAGFIRTGHLARLAQLRPGQTVEIGRPRPQRVKRRR